MSTSVKKSNYITIQSFMVKELKLTGNNLLVYAIIYGFSQDDNNYYTGSLQYLADWCNSTKRGIQKNIKFLLEKKYILKENKTINGVKFCKYKTIEQSSTDENESANNDEQSSTNNINNKKEIIDNKLSIKEKKHGKSFIKPTLEEIEQYCKERNNNVDAKRFYDYYAVNDWKDKDDKPIKNWKQKMIANWETKSNLSIQQKSKDIPKEEYNPFDLVKLKFGGYGYRGDVTDDEIDYEYMEEAKRELMSK